MLLRSILLAVVVSVLTFSSNGVLAHASTTYPCANEKGHCAMHGNSRKLLIYGGNKGQDSGYYYFEVQRLGRVGCNNFVGGDPARGIEKKCIYGESSKLLRKRNVNWKHCADEGKVCQPNVPQNGFRLYRFGRAGKWIFGYAGSNFNCSMAGIGTKHDPYYGKKKSCYISTKSFQQKWTMCGSENTVCPLRERVPGHPVLVRYGVPGRWTLRMFSGNKLNCSNGGFNVDPAPGKSKFCWYQPMVSPPKAIVARWELVLRCNGSAGCIVGKETQIGVTQGKESARSKTWQKSFSVSVMGGGGKTFLAWSMQATSTFSVGGSQTAIDSFQKTTVSTEKVTCLKSTRSLWQWVIRAEETCDITGKLCTRVARSKEFACQKGSEQPKSPPPAKIKGVTSSR